MGEGLPMFAQVAGNWEGSLEQAENRLAMAQYRLEDCLLTWHRLDRRQEWLAAHKDAHPDPAEREKMERNFREIGHTMATYKRDWGPQARQELRYWEGEVERLKAEKANGKDGR